MANQLDNAEIIAPPTKKVASGGQVTVRITYKAETPGDVLVDYNSALFAVAHEPIRVPASQGGSVTAVLTIKRLTAQTLCVLTFDFFDRDADAVEVT